MQRGRIETSLRYRKRFAYSSHLHSRHSRVLRSKRSSGLHRKRQELRTQMSQQGGGGNKLIGVAARNTSEFGWVEAVDYFRWFKTTRISATGTYVSFRAAQQHHGTTYCGACAWCRLTYYATLCPCSTMCAVLCAHTELTRLTRTLLQCSLSMVYSLQQLPAELLGYVFSFHQCAGQGSGANTAVSRRIYFTYSCTQYTVRPQRYGASN